MTKGELIVACIKLMFDNGEEQVEASYISDNLNYSERTSNIIESINRALFRIQTAKKLPCQYLTIDKNTVILRESNAFNRYDLSTLSNQQFLSVDSISWEYENAYTYAVEYRMEGNVLILPKEYIRRGEIVVKYVPKVKVLTYEDLDSKVIEYGDEILNIVPYFVKADLFEEDEVGNARHARNIFENYLEQLPTTQDVGNPKEILTYYSID